MKFHVVKEIDASPERVWSVIGDFSGSPMIGVNQKIVKHGDKNGIGTVRTITMGKSTFTERIEAIEIGKSLEYSILSGAPVKWYKGKGIIISSKRPTIIEWHGEFEAKFPVPNFIVKVAAQKNVNRYLSAVEKTLKNSTRDNNYEDHGH